MWYQMFEYAIGHWLQKATEHMIGCVLCSPGCFSLFRGKALMDDNVMKKYTTKSDEARHYVQYDQGEDRWLCTLLLQRGYRVSSSLFIANCFIFLIILISMHVCIVIFRWNIRLRATLILTHRKDSTSSIINGVAGYPPRSRILWIC